MRASSSICELCISDRAIEAERGVVDEPVERPEFLVQLPHEAGYLVDLA
jgi:hypothetical protein